MCFINFQDIIVRTCRSSGTIIVIVISVVIVINGDNVKVGRGFNCIEF